MLKFGIIRYSTRSGPDDQKILRVDAEQLRLKFHEVTSMDLSEVGNLPQLQRIDIGDNRIESIDLEPLTECKDLRYLDISENRLTHVDLSPLSNCKYLERLDISHNEIKKLDLSPLIKCSNLTELYLQFNNMRSLDVTPLLMCPKLKRVDTRGTKKRLVGAADFDKKIKKPTLFIDPLFKIAIQNNYPAWFDLTKSKTKISVVSYEQIVSEKGWRYVKEIVARTINMVEGNLKQTVPASFLEAIKMKELVGYDGTILDVIDLIPNDSTYSEGTEILYNHLIQLIKEQLENNGSTRFFDLDNLANTRASVLIPLLLRKRKEEIENVAIPIKGKRIKLAQLWATGYGHQILTALRISKTTTSDGFKKIQKAFSKLGMHIATESASQSKPSIDAVIQETP